MATDETGILGRGTPVAQDRTVWKDLISRRIVSHVGGDDLTTPKAAE